jgi:hypothetical protein
MAAVGLDVVDASGAVVWRVGRAPQTWAWGDRQYSGQNRWDDAQGVFRTVYAGDSLYGCFVEVLAYARPDLDAGGADMLLGIDEDPRDAEEFPVPAHGSIPREWIGGRLVGAAVLTGTYADVRTSGTIATLRPTLLRVALELGFADFDAAALKSAQPRELTQKVAHHLYALTSETGDSIVDGVRFASRHGDELTMWAIFERPGDEPWSRHITKTSTQVVVDVDDVDLLRAMSLHGLVWR